MAETEIFDEFFVNQTGVAYGVEEILIVEVQRRRNRRGARGAVTGWRRAGHGAGATRQTRAGRCVPVALHHFIPRLHPAC